MAARTLALLGFSEQDTLLLRSLLTLGEPLLKEKWLLVPLQEANVILADSIRITHAELTDLTASVVMVCPAGSGVANQLILMRPLRVSHLVALLNTFSVPILSPTPIDHKKIVATQESEVRNVGKELFNWLGTLLNWKKSVSNPLPVQGSLPPLSIFAPSQRTFHNPAVELRERQILKNLAQLPLFNINLSIPKLIEALQGLSDEPLTARIRLQLIDIYREPVNTLFNALGTPILRKISPLGGWEGNASDPGKMFLACADGYKSIILECYQAGNTPVSDELLLLALWRALEQLSHAVVHAYRYYRSLSPGVFLEIYQIFRYAAYFKVEDHVLHCTHPKLATDIIEGPTSIADIYKQLLLFAISDPYSLSIDYLDKTLAHLILLADKIELLSWQAVLHQHLIPHPQATSDIVDISDLEGLFIVDLDTDRPPISIIQIGPVDKIDNHWVIDARPVLHALYRSTTEIVAGQKIEGLPRRLAEQLITCLRGAGQRTESRRPVNSKVILIFGILEVHRVLSGQLLSNLDSKKYSWTVVNENSKGLMVNSAEQHQVMVGDLVGIQRDITIENGSMMVGVIRWLRVTNSGGMVLGLEILGGTPKAAWFTSGSDNAQPCILQTLPEDEEAIIVPKGFYQRGINFDLKHQDHSRCVMAGHFLQEESGFDQFELEPLA